MTVPRAIALSRRACDAAASADPMTPTLVFIITFGIRLSLSLLPTRREQTPAPIRGQLYSRVVELLSVPELAGPLSMRLIQGFAVICVRATPNIFAVSGSHFYKPIGIGQGLSRQAGDIGVTAVNNCFRLFEGRDSSSSNYRCFETRGVHCALDRSDQRHGPAKRPPVVCQGRGEAFG